MVNMQLVAVAAVSLSALTELFLLHHISRTQHDIPEKVMCLPMVKDYHDHIIHCPGE